MEQLDPAVSKHLRELRITYEIFDTVRNDFSNINLWLEKSCLTLPFFQQPNAVSTFNFMNQEGRDVAALLIAIDENASHGPKTDTSSFPPLPAKGV